MTHTTPASAVSILRDETIQKLAELHSYEPDAATMDIRLHRFARALLAHIAALPDAQMPEPAYTTARMGAPDLHYYTAEQVQACIIADRAARQSAEPVQAIPTWQERRDEDIKLNGEAQADRFAYAAYEIADLRAHIAKLERELKAARAVSDEHFQTIIAERSESAPSVKTLDRDAFWVLIAELGRAAGEDYKAKRMALLAHINAWHIAERAAIQPQGEVAAMFGIAPLTAEDHAVLFRSPTPASVTSAPARDQKQLADWLLRHPVDGSKLTFAGPPEAFGLGLSQVKMMAADGSEWTLIGGLREGYRAEVERNATLLRVVKEEQAATIADEAPTRSITSFLDNPEDLFNVIRAASARVEPTAPASIRDDHVFQNLMADWHEIAETNIPGASAIYQKLIEHIDARSTAAPAEPSANTKIRRFANTPQIIEPAIVLSDAESTVLREIADRGYSVTVSQLQKGTK